MRITSVRNPTVRFARSLARAPLREEHQLYLAEGVRLVREAIDTGQAASLAFYVPEMLSRTEDGHALIRDIDNWADTAFEVDTHVLHTIAQTETPSGVVVVLRRQDSILLAPGADAHFGVILDAISDPGNAGVIVRTAAAVGADFVAALPGSVDLFAPKVVRAAMGAHFRVQLYPAIRWEQLEAALPDTELWAIDVHASLSIFEAQWPERIALVVGNEAHGLSDETRRAVDRRVRVPMRAGVESLNAAVAAAITMYVALGPSMQSKE